MVTTFPTYPDVDGVFSFTSGQSLSSIVELHAPMESTSYVVYKPQIVALFLSGVDVITAAGATQLRLMYVHTDDVAYPVEMTGDLYSFVLRTDLSDYFAVLNPAISFAHYKFALQLTDDLGAAVNAPADWDVPYIVSSMHDDPRQ